RVEGNSHRRARLGGSELRRRLAWWQADRSARDAGEQRRGEFRLRCYTTPVGHGAYHRTRNLRGERGKHPRAVPRASREIIRRKLQTQSSKLQRNIKLQTAN